jgi:hypothetical protein
MIQELLKQDLVWGGSWKSLPDDDHFQLPNIPASPSPAMLADYGNGGSAALITIWANVTAGKYAA